MKYFIDTEFIEDGKTIDLISIGIVAEDGREYYAINGECDFRKADDWVLQNVLLPIGLNRQGLRYPNPTMEGFHGLDRTYVDKAAPFIKPKIQIKQDILNFVGYDLESNSLIGWDALNGKSLPDCSVEFYGWYCDYDWVVFCQLFGKMIDLPNGFPMYCKDIKQMCDDLGNPKLPLQYEDEHHALNDARWIKTAYEFLAAFSIRNE